MSLDSPYIPERSELWPHSQMETLRPREAKSLTQEWILREMAGVELELRPHPLHEWEDGGSRVLGLCGRQRWVIQEKRREQGFWDWVPGLLLSL